MEVTLLFETFLTPTSEKSLLIFMRICLHMIRKVHLGCNSNCIDETEDFSRSHPVIYTTL